MRITKKQIYLAYQGYKDKYPDKVLWQGLNYWSIYEYNKDGSWAKETIFKSNKEIYEYLRDMK